METYRRVRDAVVKFYHIWMLNILAWIVAVFCVSLVGFTSQTVSLIIMCSVTSFMAAVCTFVKFKTDGGRK